MKLKANLQATSTLNRLMWSREESQVEEIRLQSFHSYKDDNANWVDFMTLLWNEELKQAPSIIPRLQSVRRIDFAYFVLGERYWDRGELQEAVEVWEKVNSGLADFAFEKVHHELREGQELQEKIALWSLVAKFSHKGSYLREAGRALWNADQLKLAVETLRAASKQTDLPRWQRYQSLAEVAEIQASWKDAYEYYELALSTAPCEPVLYIRYAKVIVKQTENTATALEKLLAVAEECPANLALYHTIARYYRDIGDLVRAEDWYNQALTLKPKAYVPKLELGIIYIKQNRYVEAERLLRNAIEQRDNDPRAHYQLGRLFERQEKYTLAAEQYRQATQRNPSQPTYQSAFSRVCSYLSSCQ